MSEFKKGKKTDLYATKSVRSAEHNIKIYWGTNQDNSTRLREIVHTEFQESRRWPHILIT